MRRLRRLFLARAASDMMLLSMGICWQPRSPKASVDTASKMLADHSYRVSAGRIFLKRFVRPGSTEPFFPARRRNRCCYVTTPYYFGIGNMVGFASACCCSGSRSSSSCLSVVSSHTLAAGRQLREMPENPSSSFSTTRDFPVHVLFAGSAGAFSCVRHAPSRNNGNHARAERHSA